MLSRDMEDKLKRRRRRRGKGKDRDLNQRNIKKSTPGHIIIKLPKTNESKILGASIE